MHKTVFQDTKCYTDVRTSAIPNNKIKTKQVVHARHSRTREKQNVTLNRFVKNNEVK